MSVEYFVKHLDLDDAILLAELEEKHGIKLRGTGRGYEFAYPNGDTSRYLADDLEIVEELRKIHSSLIPHPSSLKEPVQAALADVGKEVTAAERDMRHMALQNKGWNLKISNEGYGYKLLDSKGELLYFTAYYPSQIGAIEEAEDVQKLTDEENSKDETIEETPDSELQTRDYLSDLTAAELGKYNELTGDKGWTLKVLNVNEASNFMLVRDYEDEGKVGTSAYNLLKSAVNSAYGLDAAYQIIHAIKKAATVERFYAVIEEYDLQPIIDGDTTKRFWMVENVEIEVKQALDDRANHLNLHRTYTTSLPVSASPTLPVSASQDAPALVSQILISKIVRDESLRIRPTDDTVVEEYKGKILEGARFPPVKLFYFEGKHYLTRGWHRIEAFERAKDVRTFDTTLDIIDCIVVEADYRAALLDAIGSNGTHGLRRSNDDKRRAVIRLLQDEEWSHRTDEWLAKAACVSATFISNMREELGINPTKRVTQSGREINVEKIGSKTKRKEVSDANAVTKANLQIAEAMSDTAEESSFKLHSQTTGEVIETPKSVGTPSLPLTGDEPLLKQEAVALADIVSQHLDGLLQATLISEHQFTIDVVDEAIRLNLIERDSYGRCWYIHKQDETQPEQKHESLTATVEEIIKEKQPQEEINASSLPDGWLTSVINISIKLLPTKEPTQDKRLVMVKVWNDDALPIVHSMTYGDITAGTFNLHELMQQLADEFPQRMASKAKTEIKTTPIATTAKKPAAKTAKPKPTKNPTSKKNGKPVKSVTQGEN